MVDVKPGPGLRALMGEPVVSNVKMSRWRSNGDKFIALMENDEPSSHRWVALRRNPPKEGDTTASFRMCRVFKPEQGEAAAIGWLNDPRVL